MPPNFLSKLQTQTNFFQVPPSFQNVSNKHKKYSIFLLSHDVAVEDAIRHFFIESNNFIVVAKKHKMKTKKNEKLFLMKI